jgi:cytochrome c oxidase subunit 2
MPSSLPAVRRCAGRLAPVLFALLLSGCAKEGISPQGQDVHRLFVIIMIIAAPVFLGVEAMLLWCVFRYRKRDDEPTPQTVGSTRTLGVFFVIPALIISVLFPFGEATLMRIERQATPQVVIKVEGFQWEWTFLYLNEGIFVSGKTLVRPALMVLPVDEPVQIQLT